MFTVTFSLIIAVSASVTVNVVVIAAVVTDIGVLLITFF